MALNSFDYIALGPAKGPATKLVVLFHGYGFDGSVMQSLAREISARLPGALIIMPHGPQLLEMPADESGNTLKVPQQLKEGEPVRGTQRQWFTIKGGPNELRDNVMARSKQLNEFIDAHRDACGLKDKDIAIMGFSQGGSIALATAFTRAQEVGCVVAHSTILIDHPALVRRPPAYFLYGDADEEFPQSYYTDMRTRLKKYTDDLEVSEIAGLTHKTSKESRTMVADYIARRMAP